MMLGLGVGGCILSVIAAVPWITVASRVNRRFRTKCFNSLLKQEPGWYDVKDPTEISIKINDNCLKIQNTIASEIPHLIRQSATIYYCFLAAFYSGWSLTITLTLFMLIYSKTYRMIQENYNSIAQKTLHVYQESEEIASNTFRLFKTVINHNQEQNEIHRYTNSLKRAAHQVRKRSKSLGYFVGFFSFVRCCLYCVGLFAGAYLLDKDMENPVTGERYKAGDVIAIFFCIIIAGV